jgi:hypothetical protein
MKEICLKIADDGTFSVSVEDGKEEATETTGMDQPDGGNEQQFQSLDEAISAIRQLAQSSDMGQSNMMAESQGMAQSFQSRR